ncbi:hypothetical protein [Nocardioides aequoreus]|uniref:hypothetical protein n=1 Tax=Nocardioides aequoreus TaxID=397278 RepID=UPI0004C463E9|nr:hypothetical protein [Nocardioides aequoreus]
MTTQARGGDGPTGATPSVRPTHGVDTALRVTVQGAAGRTDLVVPFGTDVAALAETYAAEVGLEGTSPRLARPSGALLDAATDLDDVVDQGALLVAVTDDGPSEAAGEAPESVVVRRPPRLAGSDPRAVLVLACLVSLAAAVIAAVSSGSAETPAWLRPAAAAVLVVGALAVALRTARHGTSDAPVYVAAPAFAAAAGFALGYAPGPGGVLLGLAVGGLSAGVVAAVGRTGAETEGEQVLRAWLVVGAAASAGAVLWLLLGASLLALAVSAFALTVVATRLLPAMAVDVDDDVLLDLDRLAVTAWSARDTPQGGRKRHQVRTPMVRDVVARSRRTVLAGVLVAAGVASVSGSAVVLGTGDDRTAWTALGGLAMVALGGGSFGLVARTFRSRWPRLLLGLTSCWLLALSGAALLALLGETWRWYVFAGLALVVPAVVLGAVKLGQGWRSVWWARTGEVLETLAGVFVLALVPLATGLFDLVRTSFS